jgi:outer membrane protein TolC
LGTGFIGYATSDIRRLFAEKSFTGLVLPTFSWRILNYGRVLNSVRNRDARFQEMVFRYQQTVLKAGQEVEDALAAFVQYHIQAQSVAVGVRESDDSVVLVQAQYCEGIVDFNRVFTTQAQFVTQKDARASWRGNIAASLITVYRVVGGGWEAVAFAGGPAPAQQPPDRALRYCRLIPSAPQIRHVCAGSVALSLDLQGVLRRI